MFKDSHLSSSYDRDIDCNGPHGHIVYTLDDTHSVLYCSESWSGSYGISYYSLVSKNNKKNENPNRAAQSFFFTVALPIGFVIDFVHQREYLHQHGSRHLYMHGISIGSWFGGSRAKLEGCILLLSLPCTAWLHLCKPEEAKTIKSANWETAQSPSGFGMVSVANCKENIFVFEIEKQEFGLKPMNCPGHCLMFKRRVHSYREHFPFFFLGLPEGSPSPSLGCLSLLFLLPRACLSCVLFVFPWTLLFARKLLLLFFIFN